MISLPLILQSRPAVDRGTPTPGEPGRDVTRGNLHLHYQPQYTAGGALTGFEALLRLDTPGTRPEDLVALAEDGGYIAPLGRWVLREACVQLAVWRAEGLSTRVAVNVSPAQFAAQDFAAQVARMLDDYRVPGDHLELELTERLPLHDLDLARSHFARLAELGVGVALDDFCFEPARWRLLRGLPFAAVKLDRSVIGGWRRGGRPSLTLRGLLPWLRRRGVGVVAEGVETAAQLEIASSLGCDRIQGFWFAPPLSAEHARSLLFVSSAASSTRACGLHPAGLRPV